MITSLSLLIIPFTTILSCNALFWDGLEPTTTGVFEGQGFSTKPTEGPKVGVAHDLLKRDLAGPRTCGFVGGSPTDVITCDYRDTCIFDKTASVVGCCSGSDPCGYATSCVPYTAYTTLCPASHKTSCATDIHINYCSLKNNGFCNTFYWPDHGVTDYECDNSYTAGIQTVLLSYSGLLSGTATAGVITVAEGPASKSSLTSITGSINVAGTTGLVVGGGSSTAAVTIPNVTGNVKGSGQGRWRAGGAAVMGGLAACLLGML